MRNKIRNYVILAGIIIYLGIRIFINNEFLENISLIILSLTVIILSIVYMKNNNLTYKEKQFEYITNAIIILLIVYFIFLYII